MDAKAGTLRLMHPETLVLENKADIQLRLTRRGDASELHDLLINNREHLRGHVEVDELSLEGVSKAVEAMLEKMDSGKYLQYRITVNGKIIGSTTVYDIDNETYTAKLGYWLGKEFTRKGYAAVAADRLKQYAFREMGLKKILLEIDPGNESSERVAMNLGAQPVSEAVTEKLEDGRNFTYRTWEINRS
jgi:ribosomal-protein-serine acetyltransferase